MIGTADLLRPGSCRLGFVGLGDMGKPMVCNLLAAGYAVGVHDLRQEATDAMVRRGATAAASVAELARTCDAVLTSLPSSEAFLAVARHDILPYARPGFTLIELGTTVVTEVRDLARALAGSGACWVEAPVSGGPDGARHRSLLMFVGGEKQAVENARPVLEALTEPRLITFCGGAGAGQAAKGVNQLAMGLVNAAMLEALAFGVRCGVPVSVLRQAVAPPQGFPGAWRALFGEVADAVAAGAGNSVGVKFRELPYFLETAEQLGFSLPLTTALHAECDRGERVTVDDKRPAPAFWERLGRD